MYLYCASLTGQAYGRGEYFGLNNKISEGYCRGGAFMIVAVLLERTYSTHDICYGAYFVIFCAYDFRANVYNLHLW